MEQAALWISIIVVIIGTLGTLLPMLPGTPLIFITALVYGWYEGFGQLSSTTLIILFVLMVITLITDYVSGSLGAKKYGASKYGTWGSLIGGILGFIFFNVLGIIIGPLVGAIAGEIIAGKKLGEASKVGIGTLMGIAFGSAVKFSLALAMAILYITTVIA